MVLRLAEEGVQGEVKRVVRRDSFLLIGGPTSPDLI